jgi:hypothetical protein
VAGKRYLDKAEESDIAAIMALCSCRPNAEPLCFVPGSFVFVVRDGKDVTGFMSVLVSNGSLVVDRLEIAYSDGKPTMRGLRAGWEMWSEIVRRSALMGMPVVCPVHIDNVRHAKVLGRLGFKPKVVVWEKVAEPSNAVANGRCVRKGVN